MRKVRGASRNNIGSLHKSQVKNFSHFFFSRGYAKHRNDYLLGDRLCKCVNHSDVNFWQ